LSAGSFAFFLSIMANGSFFGAFGNNPLDIGKECFKWHWLRFLCWRWWWHWRWLRDLQAVQSGASFPEEMVNTSVATNEAAVVHGIQGLHQLIPKLSQNF
jgi:hypothetical protein